MIPALYLLAAGSPGRANQHIYYQNALNTSASEKVYKYKAAAEERLATFCPLIVTAKWQKPLSQLYVCPRAVRARQSGGSADQGLLEEVEELGIRGR